MAEKKGTSAEKKGISDYYGPGYWDVFHRLAYQVTVDDGNGFEKQLKQAVTLSLEIIGRFPCSICRGHISEFVAGNPPTIEAWIAANDRLAFFKWTWRYHNVVNNRKGKPMVSLKEAITQYSIATTCPRA